ncbi:hypothetical protein B566_EDAN010366 [Ephemera danica]|nr:hypothetical protein B566_EDAN010366 [Ephemera danica]
MVKVGLLDGPRFRSRPMSVQAETGHSVTLSCDVDGNPPADIIWMHEDTAKMVGTTTNLTLRMSVETAGRYRCRALVHGFPEVSAEAHVYLKGPPAIISHRTQFGTLGDNVRIECVVFSVPRPQHIVWSRAGREIHASSDSDYTVLEDPLPEGVKSTLVIRDSRSTHFGSYNCSANNQFGGDVAEIHLKQQEGFRNLEIIFYSVIGSLLAVIVIGAFCFCKRKRKLKLPEVELEPAEKQSKHSDRSSNDSDLKVEIRTASSLSNVHEPGDSEPGWEERSDAATPRLTIGNGGDAIYRYSADYTDPTFPPKTDGQNNNGYVPFVDYSRDYNPPIELQRNSIYSGSHILPPQVSTATTMLNSTIDPRYSATYGNPYLRTSTNSLPHPTSSPAGSSPGVGGVPKVPGVLTPPSLQPQKSLQPLPPAYSAATTTRNGAVPQVSRLPNSPTSQFIVPSSQAAIKRGTLATHV